MSTTKIIRGYMRQSTAEILDKNPYGPVSPLWEDDISGNAIPATLIIGTGKLWTEDEVRAMVLELIEASRGEWSPPSEGCKIAAKHGLTL